MFFIDHNRKIDLSLRKRAEQGLVDWHRDERSFGTWEEGSISRDKSIHINYLIANHENHIYQLFRDYNLGTEKEKAKS